VLSLVGRYARRTLFGMNTERITVTMPAEDAQRLRRLVGEGGNVSAYVVAAVQKELQVDEGIYQIEQAFGRPSDADLARARRLFDLDGPRSQAKAS
jgi:Arc/MetJ-type ribon-helix-helix transcriptional regulator